MFIQGHLFGDIFYSIPVNRLFIQDTPVKLLNDDLFLGINHTLLELHIVNSKLAEFPSGALKVSHLFCLIFNKLYLHKMGIKLLYK